MFFFHFLLLFSNSLIVRKHISDETEVKVLSEFGFSRNGEIQISIFGLNITNTTVILASSSQYSQIHSDLRNSANLCKHPEQLNHYKYNFTSKLNTNSNMFQFLLRENGIYYPIVFNCNHKTLSVTAQYKNSNSYLDYRDRFIPPFNVLMSIIYSVIGLYWIFNMITHPSFDLALPKLFSFSCCLKGVSLAYMAKYWQELSIDGEASLKTVIIAETGSVISNSILFMVNLLGAYGLSIYRTKIDYGEIISSLSTALWFFIPRRFIHHTDDILLSVIFGLVGFAAISSFIGRISKASYFATQIYDTNQSHILIKLKSKLAIWFTSELLLATVFLLFSICYMICMLVRNSILYICEEFMIFTFVGIDLNIFNIRKDVEPPTDDEDEQEQEQIDPEGIHLIEEPQESELAFLTTRQP